MTPKNLHNPFDNLDEPESSTTPNDESPPSYTEYPTPTTPNTNIPPPSNPRKPIAIPTTTSSSSSSLSISPFLRAYPPVLQTNALPSPTFLTFLDTLNAAITDTPPLQTLDATGNILQSVPVLFPLHWVGSAVSGLAQLGGRGVARGRVGGVLERANREVFHPRGLHVCIEGVDLLAVTAGIPVLDSRGAVSGGGLRGVLRGAFGGNGGVCWVGEDVVRRWVRALESWIERLEVEVLPWSSQSRLTRFNAACRRNGVDSGGGNGGQRDVNEEEAFRRSLWLIIRDIRDGDDEALGRHS